METTGLNYFRKELFILKIVGLSLFENDGFVYKIYSYLSLVSFNFAYPNLQFISSFKYSLEDTAHIWFYDIGIYGALAKTLVVFRNGKRIKKLLDRLEDLLHVIQDNPETSSERKLAEECISISNMQSMVYWLTAAASVSVTITRCTFKYLTSDDPGNWELPFGKLEILNTTSSRNFAATLVYQAVGVSNAAVHFLTIDLITANVLCHLSYHFKILQNRLVELVKRGKFQQTNNIQNLALPQSSNQEDKEISWKLLKKPLEETVNYHLLIIEIARDMEAVFSNLLLLVMLVTLTMSCFLIYYTSMFPIGVTQMFTFSSEFCVTSLQIFLVCFWGEQISEESQRVALAATEMDFVGCDLRFQKALTLIILRSQRPLTLTAGKFADVGLTTFRWIMRSSYSAFLVLKNANEN